MYSISLALGLAVGGTLLVFGLVLHGSILDRAMSWLAEFFALHPAVQALLALSPLIVSLMLGWAMGRRRQQRNEAERIAELRRDAGLNG